MIFDIDKIKINENAKKYIEEAKLQRDFFEMDDIIVEHFLISKISENSTKKYIVSHKGKKYYEEARQALNKSMFVAIVERRDLTDLEDLVNCIAEVTCINEKEIIGVEEIILAIQSIIEKKWSVTTDKILILDLLFFLTERESIKPTENFLNDYDLVILARKLGFEEEIDALMGDPFDWLEDEEDPEEVEISTEEDKIYLDVMASLQDNIIRISSPGSKKIIPRYPGTYTINKGERAEEVELCASMLGLAYKKNLIVLGDTEERALSVIEGVIFRRANFKVDDVSIFEIDFDGLLMDERLDEFRSLSDFDIEAIIDLALNKLAYPERSIIILKNMSNLFHTLLSDFDMADFFYILDKIISKDSLRIVIPLETSAILEEVLENLGVERAFSILKLKKPTREELKKELSELIANIEKIHNVELEKDLENWILENSETTGLSNIKDQLDQSGSLAKIRKRKRISSDIFWATNPEKKKNLGIGRSSSLEGLRELEGVLNSQVFGQEEAAAALSAAVKLHASGIVDEDRPVMSFLFVGPTGVGKTEEARVLAKTLGVHLERFDMSEYAEWHTISKLIGSPPGYVGYEQDGLLTGAISKNPKSIILFDEIEKAHRSIYNTLLQVLDYGVLTDSKGNKVDFSETIVIMTSNAGVSESGKKSIGFGKEYSSKGLVERSVKSTFPPEFLNRLTKVVWFNPLNTDVARLIAKKEVSKMEALLSKKNIVLKYDEDLIDLVVKKGYSPEYGAREIKRYIEGSIKPLLVDDILFGKLKGGGTCYLKVEKDKVNPKYGEVKKAAAK